METVSPLTLRRFYSFTCLIQGGGGNQLLNYDLFHELTENFSFAFWIQIHIIHGVSVILTQLHEYVHYFYTRVISKIKIK